MAPCIINAESMGKKDKLYSLKEGRVLFFFGLSVSNYTYLNTAIFFKKKFKKNKFISFYIIIIIPKMDFKQKKKEGKDISGQNALIIGWSSSRL